MKEIAISKIKPNPDNPRLIRDEKFKELCKSIEDFPEMMKVRPIIIDEKNVIIGGNMRYQAHLELGKKKAYVVEMKGLTEEQKREMVIKDNVSFGEWDMEELTSSFDIEKFKEWGLEVFDDSDDLDTSSLNDEEFGDEDIDETLGTPEGQKEKVIQIPFHKDDYERAHELMKEFREKGIYVGGILLLELRKAKA